MGSANTTMLEKFAEFCFRRRLTVLVVIGVITAIMFYFAIQVDIKTVFSDLLPGNHPYIKVNDRFKQTFGGSNVVSIMLEVEEGDIFNETVLSKVKQITEDLQMVHAVNPFQVISLASRGLREVRASSEGIIRTPMMWPDTPRDDAEMKRLRDAVLSSDLVYGRYVSEDLKATLITVDFYDQLLKYDVAFKEILTIAAKAEGDGVRVRVVGEPILYGWVTYYLSETVAIFLITLASLILLLLLITRTWRGTLLPLLAGTISAIWALGSARLLGYHMDPLVVVVAFLITARCISHSVQFCTRFDDEIARGEESTAAAARTTMLGLFRPGMLGIVTDGACMVGVMLTPIPLLQKIAIIGAIWVATIILSVVLTTSILLSFIRRPEGYAHPIDVSPIMEKVLGFFIRIATSRWRVTVLVLTLAIFIISGISAFDLQVGDTNPGSPILWPDSRYNTDSGAINAKFEGADRMFVVVAGKKRDAVKERAVLDNMDMFQRYMEVQPEVGGSLSMADVLPKMRLVLREGNPRYKEYGTSLSENGELVYIWVSGTQPGDMDRYSDPYYRNACVSLFFHDHQGQTIRTAVARVKEFSENNPIEEAEYLLAGGLIGVLAAANEVILAGQIEAIALALLVVVVCTMLTYRSIMAGMFFMIPVMLSNTVTFSYMAIKNIGLSVNTLPVVALGIGLGVDYAYYIIDGVREELRKHDDLTRAIATSLSTAGKGVLVTALTLTISVVLWCFSSVRFQAEMGILMALWLFVSAASSLLTMPALAYVFRPRFIVGDVGNVKSSMTMKKEGKI